MHPKNIDEEKDGLAAGRGSISKERYMPTASARSSFASPFPSEPLDYGLMSPFDMRISQALIGGNTQPLTAPPPLAQSPGRTVRFLPQRPISMMSATSNGSMDNTTLALLPPLPSLRSPTTPSISSPFNPHTNGLSPNPIEAAQQSGEDSGSMERSTNIESVGKGALPVAL